MEIYFKFHIIKKVTYNNYKTSDFEPNIKLKVIVFSS